MLLLPPGTDLPAYDPAAPSSGAKVAAYCWGMPNLPLMTPLGAVDPSGAPTMLAIDLLAKNREWGNYGMDPAVNAWAMNPSGDLCISKVDGLTCYRGLLVTSERYSELDGKSITHIAVGQTHRCAATNAEAWCWGINDHGQLGIGTTADMQHREERPSAVLLPAGISITDLAISGHSTCVATSDGTYCFGFGSWGQLGDGNKEFAQATPVRVANLSGPVDRIAAGLDHFCALANGDVSCWGLSFGRSAAIGEGADEQGQTTPLRVALEGKAHDIALGNDFSCAATTKGVACWGENEDGQLGGADSSYRTMRSARPLYVRKQPLPMN
jgi:alpha-tubulin suppressor-like RCC1 family protein